MHLPNKVGWWKVVDRNGTAAYWQFHESGDGRWRAPRGSVWLEAEALQVEGEWSPVVNEALLAFLNAS